MSQVRSVKQFTALLKQERLNKGMTQAQLGELIGVGQKKIAMIETLKASPRLDLLLKMAMVLGLSLELNKEKGPSKEIKIVWE